jgi:ATP-binding cassette, subfamily C (CFTR/MRP), member 1
LRKREHTKWVPFVTVQFSEANANFQDLIESGPLFSRLMADYGGTDDQKKGEEEAAGAKDEKEAGDVAISKPLMQEEDRNTGQIQWNLYGLYMSAGGGIFWCLMILLALLAEQGAQGTHSGIQSFVWNSY